MMKAQNRKTESEAILNRIYKKRELIEKLREQISSNESKILKLWDEIYELKDKRRELRGEND